MPQKIKSIKAREILDSRGNPTIEVEVVLNNNRKAWAAVPAGASTGSHEALELRDGDKNRYQGKGVLKAVNNINNKIAPKLIGWDPTKQQKIDELMINLDGTKNKSRLGANAILGVSLAVARIAAISQNKHLYQYLRDKFFNKEKRWIFSLPMMNILNGGAHADFSVDIQEFMILPLQKTIKERIRCGVEIFQILGKILKAKKYPTTVGDEGGYAPKLKGNEVALNLIIQAIKKANYTPKREVRICLDIAASEFFQKGIYNMKTDRKKRNTKEMIEMYQKWIFKYPITSIEDGLAEDDWLGWQKLTKVLGKKVNLVGDDLFVTNIERLKKGIKMKVANAILIKLNQIGTLTETIAAIKLAKKNKYKVAISHRSGETVDDFIADLAVACNAEFIKTGSLSRGERIAKYNRLMEIEEKIAGK